MVLKRKYIFFLTGGLTLFVALFLLNLNKPTDVEAIPENPSNPDLSEEYLLMKKDEYGNIPRMDFENFSANQKHSESVSNLLNVKNVGPYNRAGRTRAFLIDKANHSHYLAGGISGGLWESYNKGQSWKPIDDQAPCLAVSCITQDVDPLKIYYGTGENYGNSAGIPGDGVYRSTDGGKSFSRLPSTLSSAFNNVICIQSSITTPNLLYVGTADSGLYKSTDAGLTFSKLIWNTNGTHNVEDIEVFKDGSIMMTFNSIGIFKSPNGNPGTFTKLTTGGLPTSGFQKIILAYCDSFPNVIYASYENSSGNDLLGIWKTIDGGVTWTKTTHPRPGMYYFPLYADVLDVKPDDPDFVLSGCVYMDYSRNGGATWYQASFSGADDHTIVFDPDNASTFYIGHDAGISKYNSATVGSSYSMLNKGYTVTQFYAGAHFSGGLSFIAGTQDNSTEASRNGDSIFQLIDPYNGDGFYTQINQQDQNVAYLSWQYGAIRKINNAQSLYPSHSPCLNELDANNNGGIDDGAWVINPYEINKLDGNQLYISTLKRIWRTTNATANWTPLTNVLNTDGNSPRTVGISNALNPTVYIGGAQLKFYRVDNAASALPGSEVNLRSSAPAIIQTSFISNITVHPTDDGTVYVSLSTISSNPRLWKVTNAKTSNPVWTSISGDLPPKLPVNWIEVDPLNPTNFFVVATDYGLYTTTNGGINWTRELSIPNVPIPQVRLRGSDRKLFIFTHGRGAWIADLPAITGTSIFNPFDAKPTLNIYPNPTTDILHFNLIGTSHIEIFNLAGQLLIDKQNENSNEIDTKQLLPGVYFIKIKNKKTVYTERFVKI